MLFMDRMKKLELLVLKRDVDAVMRYLGEAGCLQLIIEGHEQTEPTPTERETAEMKVRVEALARFLDLHVGDRTRAERSRPARPREVLREAADQIISETADLVAEESRLVQQRLSLKRSLEELSAFSELTVPFAELANLTYLTFRLGVVPEEKLEELTQTLADRAVIVGLKKEGHIMAVTDRKGKWALDSELAKVDFRPLELPASATGVPADVMNAMERNLLLTEAALSRLEERKRLVRETRGSLIMDLFDDLDVAVTVDSVKQGFASTGSVMRLSGWIPRRKFDEVAAELEKISQGRLALKSYDPEELPEVTSGKVKVPVSVRHGRVVRSFERMVFLLQRPAVRDRGPDALRRGDVRAAFRHHVRRRGPGIRRAGPRAAHQSGRMKSFEAYRQKNFGTVFIVVGRPPWSRASSTVPSSPTSTSWCPFPGSSPGLVTGRPVDHIISLVGFQKIILFFGVTIGVGRSHQFGRTAHQHRELIAHAAGGRRRSSPRPGWQGRSSSGTCCPSGCGSSWGAASAESTSSSWPCRCGALFFREPIVRLAERQTARPEGRAVRLHHGGDRRDPRVGYLLHLQLGFFPPRCGLRPGPHRAQHHCVSPRRTWWAARLEGSCSASSSS